MNKKDGVYDWIVENRDRERKQRRQGERRKDIDDKAAKSDENGAKSEKKRGKR